MTKRSVSWRLATCLVSPKLSLNILCLVFTFFILLQLYSFHIKIESLLLQQVQNPKKNETSYLMEKLRESTTFLPMADPEGPTLFLPLKDLRFSNKPLVGHTWFMSSLNDTQTKGEVQYQQFPSQSSKGKLLCLKGVDEHDGSLNHYALAYPQAVPVNATLQEGLTFVSYNHYDYNNMWHGLSAIVPFVAWSLRNQCEKPERWVLYHWGEVRFKMGDWLSEIVRAVYGQRAEFLRFRDGENPVCFEKVVVMRHNEGGMSRERRLEVFDLIRCKARNYCNSRLSETPKPRIGLGMTLLMRTGPRSFKNESAVINIFKRECKKVKGCNLKVSYSNNLTFCEQVELMRTTDVLVSPHGAQLTNLVLMDRNSSVMEFFPKGWLKLAGVGQFVYQWGANWSGMRHEGYWRDPDGEMCRFSDSDRRCMSVYKNGKIGYNETYFGDWARSVLDRFRVRKMEDVVERNHGYGCLC